MEDIKLLIKNNKNSEVIKKINNCLLKKNYYFLKDIVITAAVNKNIEIINFVIHKNYHDLLLSLIQFIDKDIFNKIFQESKYKGINKNELLNKSLYFKKDNISIEIINRLVPKLKGYKKYNFLILPFIHKNENVVNYILDNKLLDYNLTLIKKIIDYDTDDFELINFIKLLNPKLNNLINVKYKLKIKDFLISKKKENMFFSLVSNNIDYEDLLLICRNFSFESIEKAFSLIELKEFSKNQRIELCHHLITNSKLIICINYFNKIIIENDILMQRIIDSRSFEHISYFIKKTNYDYKNKSLEIDRNIKNLSYNYVEKIINNYGNHHLKNVSSIIYSLGIKQFKNRIDYFSEKYNFSNDTLLLDRCIHLNCGVNFVDKLIKLNTFISNECFYSILDSLVLFESRKKDLDNLSILSYLTRNPKKRCKLYPGITEDIAYIIYSLNYYGKYETSNYLKTFLKNSLKLETSNTIKDCNLIKDKIGDKINYSDINPELICYICNKRFKEGDNIISLDCSHIFHHNCIKISLMQNNRCPLCSHYILDLN